MILRSFGSFFQVNWHEIRFGHVRRHGINALVAFFLHTIFSHDGFRQGYIWTRLLFFAIAMLTDRQILAFTWLIWLRTAAVRLPPLLVDWANPSLGFLDEVHAALFLERLCFRPSICVLSASFPYNSGLVQTHVYTDLLTSFAAIDDMQSTPAMQVLTSPFCGDETLLATQQVVYATSNLDWQQLTDGFVLLKDAWLRLQRVSPLPSSALAAAIRVLSHRLFLRTADSWGWSRDDLVRAANPFWLSSLTESQRKSTSASGVASKSDAQDESSL